MTKLVQDEKRAYPRAEQSLSLKLYSRDANIVTHTKNISGSGLYCEIDQDIPVMTKLVITILLPNQRYKNKRMRRIEGEGVVVRSGLLSNGEKGKEKKWEIAVFFSSFSDKEKEEINKYVWQHLDTVK